MFTGGLNTPLPCRPRRSSRTCSAIDSPALDQTRARTARTGVRSRIAKNASGGGGEANDNPGAGDGDGFGLARFGDGGELIRGVAVKVGDPQFTLIWNTDGVDLDLHVLEPGGKEIYWEEPKGRQGGELDVDNTKGFGPENIYWMVESQGPGSEKVKGPGPPGTYKWFVVYWGGFGGIRQADPLAGPRQARWQVEVHHGKFSRLNERSKIYTLKVDPPGGKTDRARRDTVGGSP